MPLSSHVDQSWDVVAFGSRQFFIPGNLPKEDWQWRAVCVAYAQDLGKVSAEEESEWHLVSPINHLTLESPVSSRSLSLLIDNLVIMIPTS